MSDPTQDPIRRLEDFATTAVLDVTPLDPAQVRRLGDRRRARRRAAYAAVAAAAVVATAIPVALTAGGGGGDANPPISGTPSAAPTVITFPDGGIEVRSAGDTSKLEGTTAEFKRFIAGVWQDDADQGCATPAVTVEKYSSAGYALGGVGGCGGYVALWVDRVGQWQEGTGTQDVWDCDTLGYLGVPRSFAGDCANEAGGFGPDEVAGLRLGMSAAEVTAAGGTIEPGPAGECGALVLPGQTALAHQSDGALSPTKGLVGIFARPGMKTPERIGLGSSRAAVEAAYPNATQGVDYWAVPLGNGTEYQILIDRDGTVHELALAMTTQDCFG